MAPIPDDDTILLEVTVGAKTVDVFAHPGEKMYHVLRQVLRHIASSTQVTLQVNGIPAAWTAERGVLSERVERFSPQGVVPVQVMALPTHYALRV